MVLGVRRRARHPLAGRRRHRRGRRAGRCAPPSSRTPRAGSTERLEALATWIEALARQRRRASGPARRHRVDRARPPLRPSRRNVAAPGGPHQERHAARQGPVRLRPELGDAAVDEAIAPLILASRFGGSDLQSLLATAAANTRDQIALWQRTEVARAEPRRDMRLVIAVTLVFTLGMLIVGHGYFRPFGTPAGQIALLVVAGLFAAGFAAMNRLSRPEPMPRLFSSEDAPE